MSLPASSLDEQLKELGIRLIKPEGKVCRLACIFSQPNIQHTRYKVGLKQLNPTLSASQ